MEKDNTLKVLVTTFVVLLLAIAFLSSIATQTTNTTSLSVVTDETTDLSANGCLTADGQVNESSDNCVLTVTNAPTGWKQVECPLTSIVVGNDTTELTLDTDYTVVASTGVITLLNTTETENGTIGNDLLVDYEYCGDNYVTSSWGRTLLGTNVGLYAIAILAVVILGLYLLLGKRDDD